MSRHASYLKTAISLVEAYQGREPLAAYLKKYFSLESKHGSRDRKQIAQLCYSFFRTGRSAMQKSTEYRILAGLFLSASAPNELLEALHPSWNTKAHLTFTEKLATLSPVVNWEDIFPWPDELSAGVDHRGFCCSLLQQPGLFLRLRPGREQYVADQLGKSGISFRQIRPDCLELVNATAVDKVLQLDRDAVVQDDSSQLTGQLFAKIPGLDGARVWDCCAASGGKSIMLYDREPAILLTVTDIRESILSNLKKRFATAGIRNYHSGVADLTAPPVSSAQPEFDCILCDAPCSGSGTWSRTPEQLYYFNLRTLGEFAQRQKKILSGVIPRLKPGGYLVYITCSVFHQENEDIVSHAVAEHKLQLVEQQLFTGYNHRADSMFAALLKKGEG